MDPLRSVRDRSLDHLTDDLAPADVAATTAATVRSLDELPDPPLRAFLASVFKGPLERPVTRTPWDAATLVTKFQAKWPGLTETGARTLAAQVTTETGRSGTHCYGFNLGNVKASAAQPHQYLARTWEVYTPAHAAAAVAKAAPLARLATDEECRANGWGHTADQAVVVYSPPHPATRFRAFATLDEGVDAYVAKHAQVNAAHPEMLAQLNAGDAAGAAHTLKQARYYSGNERDYARSMSGNKAAIDRALGPAGS